MTTDEIKAEVLRRLKQVAAGELKPVPLTEPDVWGWGDMHGYPNPYGSVWYQLGEGLQVKGYWRVGYFRSLTHAKEEGGEEHELWSGKSATEDPLGSEILWWCELTPDDGPWLPEERR